MTMALNVPPMMFDGKQEITCYTCHRGAASALPTLVFPGRNRHDRLRGSGDFPALAARSVSMIGPGMSPGKAPATVVSGASHAAEALRPRRQLRLPACREDIFAKYDCKHWAGMPRSAEMHRSSIQGVGGDARSGSSGALRELPCSTEAMEHWFYGRFDPQLPGKQLVSIQFPDSVSARLWFGFDTIGWHCCLQHARAGHSAAQWVC